MLNRPAVVHCGEPNCNHRQDNGWPFHDSASAKSPGDREQQERDCVPNRFIAAGNPKDEGADGYGRGQRE
jgi:hypothetical protein